MPGRVFDHLAHQRYPLPSSFRNVGKFRPAGIDVVALTISATEKE
jgi:hypothetical protein